MTRRPGQAALVEAVSDRHRNLVILLAVAITLGLAMTAGSKLAYYGAALVVFTIWMVWFVLTAIEWLRIADF